MPKRLDIPNGGYVRLDWTVEGVPMFNVLGIQGTATISVNQALADQIDSIAKGLFNSSGLQALMTSQVQLLHVTVRSLNNANLAPFQGAGPSAAGSGAAADMLPLATAFCVTLRTANVGQAFRGRIFLPGFTEAQNDSLGQISSAGSTAALDMINGLRTGLPSGIRLAINHKWLPERLDHAGNTLPERQPFVTEVISCTSRSSRWSQQRRRNLR